MDVTRVQSPAPAAVATPPAPARRPDGDDEAPPAAIAQESAPAVDGGPEPARSRVTARVRRDEPTGVDVVEFRDRTTGEVVSQLPYEQVLAVTTAFVTAARRSVRGIR